MQTDSLYLPSRPLWKDTVSKQVLDWEGSFSVTCFLVPSLGKIRKNDCLSHDIVSRNALKHHIVGLRKFVKLLVAYSSLRIISNMMLSKSKVEIYWILVILNLFFTTIWKSLNRARCNGHLWHNFFIERLKSDRLFTTFEVVVFFFFSHALVQSNTM